MIHSPQRDIFAELLEARGLHGADLDSFLHPDYNSTIDPFLLPDMQTTVDRLVTAHTNQEIITIYGDYDVDGITATALLVTALKNFGFTNLNFILPDRLIDGYGLSPNVPDRLKSLKTDLLVTVDCGSSDAIIIDEITSLNIDTIITDHHEVKGEIPKALALVNPKKPQPKTSKTKKPKIPQHLSGVAVAFQLVRALQTKLPGLPVGQEKWLLDLVAIGTICDCMDLLGENRTLTHFGLKVLAKTRRPGLKSLMQFAKIDPKNITARAVAFQLGPRLNAAGRIDDAHVALDLLLAPDSSSAFPLARTLDDLNKSRRALQDHALKSIASEPLPPDPVLFVKNPDLHEGIIGIVASKLLDQHQKPVFVFTTSGDSLKASARSFGDFSLAAAIDASRDLIIKGGGHHEAAGVTISPENYDAFKTSINQFYNSLNLPDQTSLLSAREDLAITNLSQLDIDLYENLLLLEPFGIGNPEPIFKLPDMAIARADRLGSDKQHLKLTVLDDHDNEIKLLAWSAPDHWFLPPNSRADLWISLMINEWQGRRSIEGRLLDLQLST